MERKFALFFDLVHRSELTSSERLDAIRGISAGRTASLKELSPLEYNELVKWAKEVERSKNGAMRGRIIYLMLQMGYKTPNDEPDWNAINTYIQDRCGNGNAKRRILNKLKHTELKAVTTQIEQYFKTWQKSQLK